MSQRISGLSLRTRLLIFILLVLLPALGLMVNATFAERRRATAQVEATVQRLVQQAAREQEQLVAQTHQLLLTLAQIPDVRGQDAQRCTHFLAILLPHYPRYTNLGVIAPDGTLVCSAPPATPTNLADRPYFQRALQTRAFAIGEYQVGRVTHKPTINLAIPILDAAGQVHSVLFVALDLGWLNQFAADAQLPPDSALLVIDRNATILARAPHPEQWVGRSVPEAPIVQAILAHQSAGVAEVAGVDGIPRLYAFAPLPAAPESGMYVGIGVSQATALAEVNAQHMRNLTLLGLVSLLALAAIWVGSDHFVLRPVQALVRATHQVAAGDLQVCMGLATGTDELGQLARAFDTMAASLEQRETARQQAEAALRASEARKAAVLEHALDCIITIDHQGYILEFNPAAEQTFGYRRAEVLGRELADLIIPPSLREAHRQGLAHYRATGAGPVLNQRIELVAMRADGSEFPIELAITCIPTAGPPLFTGFVRDITARRQAEAALEAERALLARRVEERTADLSLANAELERAMRLKDEFLASMSHELRTPLNAILGLSEALQEKVYGPLTPQQRTTLQQIEESGRHLLSLINDILDLSKIGAGQLELQFDPVSVPAVCEASVQFIKQLAHARRLTVQTALDPAVTTVQADARRLKQMLVNLLANAVKFTPEGGMIGLEVRGDAANQVVTFSVWDTGIGIAPEQIGRLFRPFVQLDSSLARQYAGTGLGLALVARMTELHGGSIRVESTPGEGSHFTLALPWTTDAASMARELDESGTDQLAWRHGIQRVLIVEDSPSAAEQVSRYLREWGLETVIHRHGDGVIAHTVAVQPNVIVLDLLLPHASGWEVLTQLKTDPRTQAIPVLIISVVDERAQGLALGATAYLLKPIDRDQLLRALRQIAGACKAPAVEPGDAAVLRPPLILIVEDTETNITMLSDYLRSRAYAVVVARNGAEAIARAEETPPDLILMDIQMPGMDGLEATQRIRAIPALAHTPIIALTALAMVGDRERCLAAGANDYLSKPISLKALSAAITAQLAQPLAGAPNRAAPKPPGATS